MRRQLQGLIQYLRIVIVRLEVEHNDGRNNLRARAEGAGTDIEEESGIGPGGALEGEKTVALTARFGHHPVRHLPLQHHDQSGEEVISRQ